MLSLLVFLVVAGLIWYLITLLPLPEPFPMIIRIVFILFCILILLQFFGVVGGPIVMGRYGR